MWIEIIFAYFVIQSLLSFSYYIYRQYSKKENIKSHLTELALVLILYILIIIFEYYVIGIVIALMLNYKYMSLIMTEDNLKHLQAKFNKQ